MKPPVAPVHPHTHTEHSLHREDPYFWLNDRENQAVIDYLNQENDYTAHQLAHTKALQTQLFEEITGRIKQTDMSVPYRSDGYFFYTRYEEGKEYPIYCRKKGSLEAQEEVLLDGNERAADHEYYQVGGLSQSRNGQLLACGEDTVGRRLFTIRFLNLETGDWYPEAIEHTSGSVAWAADNTTLFYTKKDDTLRASAIYRHTLGTDPSTDVLVYEETDEAFITFVYTSKSRELILIGSDSTLSSEYRYLPANDPQGSFQVILPRERGHEYSVAHFSDRFYVLTNKEAQNFRLMALPVGAAMETWEEVIPHREDTLLEDVEIFESYLVVQEKRDGLNRIRFRNWATGVEDELPFEDPAYTAYLSTNREFNTTVLRYGYTSLTTPSTVYDFDMATGQRTLLKQQEVIGTFSANDYTSQRLWATAQDGVKVPISLVKHKNTSGTAPLLLYGYGSYGHSMDPYFSTARLSLLDRGFTFAIAHIRGGEDLGRAWYENGRQLQKKNTFTDFIACAEHLIQEGFTTSDQLMGMGGSAGGLLIGAVANLRPDLFRGLVAQVPFVDVITTMLDDTIPLTTGEYDEWGNPNDKEFFDYILSYSPYDNVSRQDYPAMLITTGLHDSQVQYWEPAKWVARLRAVGQSPNPLYLHTNMDAGHSGSSGRFEQFKEVALEYAFLLDLVGKG